MQIALENFRNEAEVQKNLDHKNIVKLYDFIERIKVVLNGDPPKDVSAIILENCQGGDFLEYLMEGGAYPLGMCKYLSRQVLSALDYLHK